MSEESQTEATSTIHEPHSFFDDPVQRTRCLIQYIRMRKQRMRDELAKRNALKKQKKDAKATLQNARDNLKTSQLDVERCEQRMHELNQLRHTILTSYKLIVNKESERKRQREADEEARRTEEQYRLQQQAATLGFDTSLLQHQLKSAQLLSMLAAFNGRPPNHIAGNTSATPNIAPNTSHISANNGSSSASVINQFYNALSASMASDSAQQLPQPAFPHQTTPSAPFPPEMANFQQTQVLNFLRQQYGITALNAAFIGQQQPAIVPHHSLLISGNNVNTADISSISSLLQQAQEFSPR